MQKIRPFLWYDNQAEEAMKLYVSIFKNSKVGDVMRASPDGPVFSVTFELDGQPFMALNGGPDHPFSDAVSFFVDCKDQAEVDELWGKLTADGGEAGPCGWLKDKFGLSWQIIPQRLMELLGDSDPAKAQRAMQAMLKMSKINVRALEAAAKA